LEDRQVVKLPLVAGQQEALYVVVDNNRQGHEEFEGTRILDDTVIDLNSLDYDC
jgi:hypothetical protein